MSKRMKIADLWDYLPPEARYVAMDKNGEWHWYAGAINKTTTEWFRIDNERYAHIGIAIDYTCDWNDSLHERPQEIKPGFFARGSGPSLPPLPPRRSGGDMKRCLVCSYSGEFGRIEINAPDGYTSAILWLPKPLGHRGSVDLLVCPNCGAVSIPQEALKP